MGNLLHAFSKKEDKDEVDYIDKNERVTKSDVVEYCKILPFCHFNGETSNMTDADSNNAMTTDNLGFYLLKMDKSLRESNPLELNSEYLFNDLKHCSIFRCREQESEEHCFKRLNRDAIRFTNIYKERSVKKPEIKYSELLEDDKYWGTRQQLLFGKVVCDWLCEEDMPPMDPIFGVLLNPTGGKVGPGDSGLFHEITFDDFGEMAHHAAVHDGFGYLLNNHDTGPGYDYLDGSILSDYNPLAGQLSGISFWKHYINEIQEKLRVINAFKMM